jgi:hypothetical protein
MGRKVLVRTLDISRVRRPPPGIEDGIRGGLLFCHVVALVKGAMKQDRTQLSKATI